ncbi:MAG: stage III sporulation protein AE [Oscillospiraceae bacterium]|nr:stage III sporulation protein AE [Oscillospiraceae bacterium]
MAICCCATPAAAEEWAEITADLPPEVTAYMDEDADGMGWQKGIRALGERASALLAEELTESVRGAASLLLIVIATAVAEGAMTAAGDGKVPNYVPMAAVLAVTGAAVGGLDSLASSCADTLEQLHVLSELLLPAIGAAMTAAGGVASASMRQVATVFLSQVLIALMQALLPLVYCLIGTSAADVMLPDHHFKAIATAIRKVVTWALTACVVLYTGYLTVGGAVAGSADRLAMQAARSAISAAVPVVGGIISDASGVVLAGAETIKNAMGVAGLLAVLGICMGPFLTLLVQFVMFKAVSFLAGVLGGAVAAYLDAIGSAYALLLGMVGTGALVLIISLSTSLRLVMA